MIAHETTPVTFSLILHGSICNPMLNIRADEIIIRMKVTNNR